MNNIAKKYIFMVMFLLFAIILGYISGVCLAKKTGRALDDKVVAFRVGVRKDYVDYDLLSMLNYMKCKYEKEGYEVKEYAYEGDLYPTRLDNAGINLFIRGDFVSYDKRVYEKAHNIYFVQRFAGGYIEEFRNFDEYLSIQKNLINGAKQKGVNVGYLESGSCEKENLDFTDAKNIIYIYEIENKYTISRVNEIKNVKVFSTMEFAKLSENERENELRKAKVVVFDRDLIRFTEKDYVPYAVYDLLSYGKKVITNAYIETKLPEGVIRFSDVNEMIYFMKKY